MYETGPGDRSYEKGFEEGEGCVLIESCACPVCTVCIASCAV